MKIYNLKGGPVFGGLTPISITKIQTMIHIKIQKGFKHDENRGYILSSPL